MLGLKRTVHAAVGSRLAAVRFRHPRAWPHPPPLDNQGEVPYGACASFAGGDGSRTRHARPSQEACRNRAYERGAWRGSPRGKAWFGLAWLCLAGQGLAWLVWACAQRTTADTKTLNDNGTTRPNERAGVIPPFSRSICSMTCRFISDQHTPDCACRSIAPNCDQ